MVTLITFGRQLQTRHLTVADGTAGSAVGMGFSVPDVLTDILILAMPLYWVSRDFTQFFQGGSRPLDVQIAHVLLEEGQCLRGLSFRWDVSTHFAPCHVISWATLGTCSHINVQHNSRQYYQTHCLCHYVSRYAPCLSEHTHMLIICLARNTDAEQVGEQLCCLISRIRC